MVQPVLGSESDCVWHVLGLRQEASAGTPQSQSAPVRDGRAQSPRSPSSVAPATLSITFHGQGTVPTVCQSREVAGGARRQKRKVPSPPLGAVSLPVAAALSTLSGRRGVTSAAPRGPRRRVRAAPGSGGGGRSQLPGWGEGASGRPGRGNSGDGEWSRGKGQRGTGTRPRRFWESAQFEGAVLPRLCPRGVRAGSGRQEQRPEHTAGRGPGASAPSSGLRAPGSCSTSHFLRGKKQSEVREAS